MANTTHGLPYPVGTDKVVDGDDAIKALAEAVDVYPGFAKEAFYTLVLAPVTGNTGWGISPVTVDTDYFTTLADGVTVLKSGVYIVTMGVAASAPITWRIIDGAQNTHGSARSPNTASALMHLPAGAKIAPYFYAEPGNPIVQAGSSFRVALLGLRAAPPAAATGLPAPD